jgi:hypothetical protein
VALKHDKLLQGKNTSYSSENRKKSKKLTGVRRMNCTFRILHNGELLEGLYAFI